MSNKEKPIRPTNNTSTIMKALGASDDAAEAAAPEAVTRRATPAPRKKLNHRPTHTNSGAGRNVTGVPRRTRGIKFKTVDEYLEHLGLINEERNKKARNQESTQATRATHRVKVPKRRPDEPAPPRTTPAP